MDGISPSGSLSLERQVTVSPMATLLTSKVSESMLGGRFPTVAVLVLVAVPPEESVTVSVHAMVSLGLAWTVSKRSVLDVERVAPVV